MDRDHVHQQNESGTSIEGFTLGKSSSSTPVLIHLATDLAYDEERSSSTPLTRHKPYLYRPRKECASKFFAPDFSRSSAPTQTDSAAALPGPASTHPHPRPRPRSSLHGRGRGRGPALRTAVANFTAREDNPQGQSISISPIEVVDALRKSALLLRGEGSVSIPSTREIRYPTRNNALMGNSIYSSLTWQRVAIHAHPIIHLQAKTEASTSKTFLLPQINDVRPCEMPSNAELTLQPPADWLLAPLATQGRPHPCRTKVKPQHRSQVPRPTQPDIASTQETSQFEKRAIGWIDLPRLHRRRDLRAARYRHTIENLSVESTCHVTSESTFTFSTGTWNRTRQGQLNSATQLGEAKRSSGGG